MNTCEALEEPAACRPQGLWAEKADPEFLHFPQRGGQTKCHLKPLAHSLPLPFNSDYLCPHKFVASGQETLPTSRAGTEIFLKVQFPQDWFLMANSSGFTLVISVSSVPFPVPVPQSRIHVSKNSGSVRVVDEVNCGVGKPKSNSKLSTYWCYASCGITVCDKLGSIYPEWKKCEPDQCRFTSPSLPADVMESTHPNDRYKRKSPCFLQIMRFWCEKATSNVLVTSATLDICKLYIREEIHARFCWLGSAVFLIGAKNGEPEGHVALGALFLLQCAFVALPLQIREQGYSHQIIQLVLEKEPHRIEGREAPVILWLFWLSMSLRCGYSSEKSLPLLLPHEIVKQHAQT